MSEGNGLYKKMIEMRSHLWGVQQRMQEMQSTHTMTTANAWCKSSYGSLNRKMNMPQIQKIMREFNMESEKMEMTTEVVGDAIDDAMEGDEDEEDTEKLVGEVLAGIGLDMTEKLNPVPQNNDKEAEKQSGGCIRIEARLQNLRS